MILANVTECARPFDQAPFAHLMLLGGGRPPCGYQSLRLVSVRAVPAFGFHASGIGAWAIETESKKAPVEWGSQGLNRPGLQVIMASSLRRHFNVDAGARFLQRQSPAGTGESAAWPCWRRSIRSWLADRAPHAQHVLAFTCVKGQSETLVAAARGNRGAGSGAELTNPSGVVESDGTDLMAAAIKRRAE
jgi:hypothetical protein